ncbi:phosphatidyl-N-methylethanolamine N-methyltransferase isoform X1 [Elaeis guineensis]|uniref:phosphatidyl-N-methylethanolamine N-methyltransferase n=1 Tax=Elaeis guineensis var. tenera TaxID=51953 RepID=A0A6J0PSL4_ELAGV|nr:phosphatidyl-N-methylethanolamine N-methyltransferase isoform X1 [Elaeis guineensis]
MEGAPAAVAVAVAVGIGVMLPFPFYYLLWNYPQAWVDVCGKGVDPSHRMAQVSHVLKIFQFLALFSVARFSWPPWYCYPLVAVGQYLNFNCFEIFIKKQNFVLVASTLNSEIIAVRVYQLLGEAGTYYGVRFGKNIPWVTEFPFGYVKDPQYVGSILSLLAILCWVPFQYVFLWVLSYLFMMWVESKEDPATRAKPLS